MKLLIKLALLCLIINGAYQVGSAYVTHYQFRDDVQQVVQFSGNKEDAWVHDRIVDLATQYDVPVSEKAIEINNDRSHTKITIYITQPQTYQFLAPYSRINQHAHYRTVASR